MGSFEECTDADSIPLRSGIILFANEDVVEDVVEVGMRDVVRDVVEVGVGGMVENFVGEPCWGGC